MITRQISVNGFFRIFRQRPVLIRYFHSSKHVLQVFDRSPHPEVMYLNHSMLDNIQKNRPNRAHDAFKKQLQSGFPDNVDPGIVALALKACNGDLGLGSQIQGFAVSSGLISFTTVLNSLMSVYFKAGSFERALCIFENLDDPDIVSWNTVLSGLKSEAAFDFALRMNCTGVLFDPVSYTTLLSYCLDFRGFLFGQQLHSLIVKFGLVSEVFVANALITLYARQELLADAKRVFEEMPVRDLVSWGAIISGYAQEGSHGLEAIELFVKMLSENVKPDHVSITGAISSCNNEGNPKLGRQIHCFSIKIGYDKHVSVCNVLMSTYSKSEDIEGAKLVFRDMYERNVVSWTTMISMADDDAVSLFNQMRLNGVYPNDVTFVGLLHSITSRNLIQEGRAVHGYCVKTSFTSELNVTNCLITMYAKFEEMENSLKVFEEIPYREIISWNSLISGYAKNRQYQEAVETYLSAILELNPNAHTFGSVLGAIGAAESTSLRHGQRCHAHIIKLGLITDPIVSGALLDMYGKRGSISESLTVFNETSRLSQFAWTAVISAYARHGDYDSAMRMFKQMEEEGVKPDSITFLSVLTACGRKGMVDHGRQLFDSMIKDHGIEPSPEHYSCMVDILGRAGRLDEAEELLNKTPGGPRLSALQSLLGACRVHGNVEMAERVMDALMEVEPNDSGSYVLMSNLYAEKGHWEKVARIRKGMREKGVVKEIGFSWVDVGDADGSMSLQLHGFSSGDMSHPQYEEIFSIAKCLGQEMQFLRGRGERMLVI